MIGRRKYWLSDYFEFERNKINFNIELLAQRSPAKPDEVIAASN